MVEVFKTNIEHEELANLLATKLRTQFPGYKINFDLQDCDKILRVEGKTVSPDKIMEVVTTTGYLCEVLE